MRGLPPEVLSLLLDKIASSKGTTLHTHPPDEIDPDCPGCRRKSKDDEKDVRLISLAGQRERIEEYAKAFNKPTKIKIGDYVVRNKFGKKTYRFPMDNQLALVLRFIPPVHNGEVADMEILVINEHEKMEVWHVDSRYFEIDRRKP